MTNIFIGIDNSMTSPGLVCLNEDESIRWMKFFAHKPKHEGWLNNILYGETYPIYASTEERFDKLSDFIINTIMAEKDIVHIAIEGYSYGSSGSRLFQIAENTGLLKHKMYKNNISFTEVAPSAVKKFATGKGNCGKDLVYKSFVEKTNINLFEYFGIKSTNIVSPISDIADAYSIARWLRGQWQLSAISQTNS